MKKALPYLLLLFSILFSECNSQQAEPFDRTKIVKASELNFAFSDKRGIELGNGITVRVEQNMRVLAAYINELQLWKADVFAKCGEHKVGEAEIRFIKIDCDKINVVFGKHSFANVVIKTGSIECLGAD